MKLNMSLMKLIIKLLILLILIVMLVIIAMFLYSAKYWPDVYNYVNANITITHIPKRSEIDVIEETTEHEMTTNIYDSTDSVTEVFDGDYFNFDDVESKRKKRGVIITDIKDYSEVPKTGQFVDYFFNIDDPESEMNDSVDESKLTTNMEYAEMIPGIVSNARGYLKNIDRCSTTNAPQLIFPWLAAIFIKNDTSSQFEYYCDGALLSENIVITAARCLYYYGTWAKSDDLLVLLGKTSLHTTNGYEKVVKVKDSIIHANYTIDGADNDLAILVLEDRLEFSEGIQPACLGSEEYEESLTTGWAVTGELTPISLNADRKLNCNNLEGSNTYCGIYSTDPAVCPSYGGMHVARHTNTWHLHGIRHGDPTEQGPCFDNTVFFTDLSNYMDWIVKYIK